MVAPTDGEIVLVPFPFSDLAHSNSSGGLRGRGGTWGLGSVPDHEQSVWRSGGGAVGRPRLRLGRIVGRQFRPARQTLHGPQRVDDPLGRRPEPNCLLAGSHRSRGGIPTSRQSVMARLLLPPHQLRQILDRPRLLPITASWKHPNSNAFPFSRCICCGNFSFAIRPSRRTMIRSLRGGGVCGGVGGLPRTKSSK